MTAQILKDQMGITDWWWTGRNNASDGNYFPPSGRYGASLLKRCAYRLGWVVGIVWIVIGK